MRLTFVWNLRKQAWVCTATFAFEGRKVGFALAGVTETGLPTFMIIISIGVLPLFRMIIVLIIIMRAITVNVRDVLAAVGKGSRYAPLSHGSPGSSSISRRDTRGASAAGSHV